MGAPLPLAERSPILLQSLDGNSLVCCDLLALSSPGGLRLAELGGHGLEPLLLGGEYVVPHDGGGDVTFNFLHTSPYRKACLFLTPVYMNL